MTEYLDRERLEQLARFVGDRQLALQRPSLEMRWVIDPATGRPIIDWVRAEAQLLEADIG